MLLLNNTNNIFISPFENTQFFSVINSIILLGQILNNDTKLETFEANVESISIINALCEFLERNSQREEKVIDLGHRLLQDTEFYGSNNNESIHLTFVNAMLNNIIANTVSPYFRKRRKLLILLI